MRFYAARVTAEVEQVYRYARPSVAEVSGGRADVRLSTSGGRTADGPAAHPRLFEGFVEHAEQSATALLAVAEVARTRFYVPPGMLARVLRNADPVITSDGDRLRFESLSACCGVYVRLDVLADGLDGPPAARGTTNVDLNPPVRTALASVVGTEPLHLRVGEDLEVSTLDGSVVERRVPLSPRWVTAFGEVQHASARLRPVAEVDGREARRFVQSVATTATNSSAATWADVSGRGLRLTGRPGADAVPLPGPDRLRALRPLLRHATGLRAYAPADAAAGTGAGASAWELQLPAARVTVVLSPDRSRGFSGEGGVLYDLADDVARSDAQLLTALLAYEPRLDVDHLATETGLPVERVRAALSHLAADGRVGYDLHAGSYFHRDLPFDLAGADITAPRLREAHELVAAGAVRMNGGTATVRSGNEDRLVVIDGERGYRCTCPWWARHGGDRGPCKHVLAVHISTATAR